MDDVGFSVEKEVNFALPYYFKFHKISKLVIALGKKEGSKDYFEVLGVAKKQYPNFDLEEYKKMTDDEKLKTLREITIEVFDWLIANFSDSQCFEAAKQNLKWEC